MSLSAGADYWKEEGARYRTAHARLRLSARWLIGLPQRRVLDIGCASAVLSQLLPGDFAYFGSDITNDAARTLAPGHFLQRDFNRNQDLSYFSGQSIDAIHIGGVLEYLHSPQVLLSEARRLVPAGSPLVVSIINFEARYYAADSRHHAGWVFKPRFDEFLKLLQASGWRHDRVRPFLGRGELMNAWFGLWGRALGWNHPWMRRKALQFVILARAI